MERDNLLDTVGEANNMKLTAQPEEVGLCSRRLARIEPWMREYVDSGRLPNAMTVVTRRGEVVYSSCYGLADIEAKTPITEESIYRIFSMTKPITSVAVMMLYEDGCFQLDDPAGHYVPELDEVRVFKASDAAGLRTEPVREPITIRNLLTHTAGFTYSFGEPAAVAGLYRSERLDFGPRAGSLAEVVARLAEVPLVHQPGERWHYGVATDVLGYLVERVSGQRFDEFLRERILEPLGMRDTSFELADDNTDRMTSLYTPCAETGQLRRVDTATQSRHRAGVTTFSGGGGLLSTAGDYHRFTQMLLNQGDFENQRLLGRKTVEFMTCNHLRGDLAEMGQASFNETSFEGIGFGLGFAVTLDSARAAVLGSPGEYSWGGMASTAFWVDPSEEMTVMFFTQLTPSSTYPIRRELRVLTYQSLT
jgi:CubicO group peptidase (beta-lactamase class C family)